MHLDFSDTGHIFRHIDGLLKIGDYATVDDLLLVMSLDDFQSTIRSHPHGVFVALMASAPRSARPYLSHLSKAVDNIDRVLDSMGWSAEERRSILNAYR